MKLFSRIGDVFDTGKKIAGGVVAVIGLITLPVTGMFWLDARFAKAGEVSSLRGQLNYQTNELKLEGARTRLEQAEGKLLEFQLRGEKERASVAGRQFEADLTRRIEQTKGEIVDLQARLRQQRRESGSKE